MEYVIVRGRGRIGIRVESPRDTPAFRRCSDLGVRYYVEGGDLVIDATLLCPAEDEGELVRAGYEAIGRVSEEEARRLPRFYALEGIDIEPAH